MNGLFKIICRYMLFKVQYMMMGFEPITRMTLGCFYFSFESVHSAYSTHTTASWQLLLFVTDSYAHGRATEKVCSISSPYHGCKLFRSLGEYIWGNRYSGWEPLSLWSAVKCELSIFHVDTVDYSITESTFRHSELSDETLVYRARH